MQRKIQTERKERNIKYAEIIKTQKLHKLFNKLSENRIYGLRKKHFIKVISELSKKTLLGKGLFYWKYWVDYSTTMKKKINGLLKKKDAVPNNFIDRIELERNCKNKLLFKDINIRFS